MTLVEVMVALVIVTITMTALLATLITGVKAGRVAEGRARANQIAADELERLRYIDWDELGFYTSDFGTFPVFHDGESVVSLGALPPVGRGDAPLPIRTVTVDSRDYTVETWVTWEGSSSSTPNDGTKYAAKRISITVSYDEQDQTRFVSSEGLRAPLPTEMKPPAGASGVVQPVTLSVPAVQYDQPLTADGKLTQDLLLSVMADTGADAVEVSYVDAAGLTQTVELSADATGTHWTAVMSAGTGTFTAGTHVFSFVGTRAGAESATSQATVTFTGGAPGAVTISEATALPIQILDRAYHLTEPLTISAATSASVTAVTASFTLNTGAALTVDLQRSGTTWTTVLEPGTGPFKPGNVVFTLLATAPVGTANTTATVTLTAPYAGAPAVGKTMTAVPSICVTKDERTTHRESILSVTVANVSANDDVQFDVGGVVVRASEVESAGSNGFVFTGILPEGQAVPGTEAWVKATRSDGATSDWVLQEHVAITAKKDGDKC